MFDLFKKNHKAEAAPVEVTRDTVIGDLMDIDSTVAPLLMEIGMHCLGCPASRGETIEEACMVHGADCDALLARLNEHIANNRA